MNNLIVYCKYIKNNSIFASYEYHISQNTTSTLDVTHRIDMLTKNGEMNFEEGCRYINSQLSIGNSLIVGVATGAFHGNQNPLTGHFINIAGVGIELINGTFSNFYTYYDNGTSNKAHGTDLNNNRLRLQTGLKGRYFYDNTGHVGIRGTTLKVPYKLTEIRRNAQK